MTNRGTQQICDENQKCGVVRVGVGWQEEVYIREAHDFSMDNQARFINKYAIIR